MNVRPRVVYLQAAAHDPIVGRPTRLTRHSEMPLAQFAEPTPDPKAPGSLDDRLPFDACTRTWVIHPSIVRGTQYVWRPCREIDPESESGADVYGEIFRVRH
jgi:hypothetical protein